MNRIRDLREDRDLRQIDVANAVGIDQQTISNYETERTRPDSEALIRLVEDLRLVYPDIRQVIGHRDTSPDRNGDGIISPNEFIKMCPCFDVRNEFR